jgi:D-alanyl-D-alanine carboxypeptidase/D-alanyl-D-alanine-endopeptidase (penicillin-binding protein 4)
MTQVLRFWLKRPDLAKLRECLPILGVDGMLAGGAGNTPARGKVLAKTGSAAAYDPLSGQIVVQGKAIGGFFQGVDHQWHTFAVVVNSAGGSSTIEPVITASRDLGQIAAILWKRANP